MLMENLCSSIKGFISDSSKQRHGDEEETEKLFEKPKQKIKIKPNEDKIIQKLL